MTRPDNRKLTERKVRTIKREWRDARDTARLAKRYRVSKRLIQLIVCGERWAWV